MRLDLFSDTFPEQIMHLNAGNAFNESDILHSDLSSDYPTVHEVNLDKQEDRDLVKPKEALERLKFCVKKATCFVVCRGEYLRLYIGPTRLFLTNFLR